MVWKYMVVKNLIPCVKKGGGSIMIWTSFVVSGPGQIGIIDWAVNSKLYKQILQENTEVNLWAEAQQNVDHAAKS